MKKAKDESGQGAGYGGRFHFYSSPLGQVFRIIWIGFFGFAIWNLIYLDKSKDLPSYYLYIRGQDLVLSESSRKSGEGWRESVLATKPVSSIRCETESDHAKSHMVISIGGKKIVRDGNYISDAVIASKGKSVFFTEAMPRGPKKAQIWQWSEHDGFHLLYAASGHYTNLCLSPNEDALAAVNETPLEEDDSDESPRFRYSTKLVSISLIDKKVTTTDVDLGFSLCSILDKDNVLVSEYNHSFIAIFGREVYRLNLKTESKARFLPKLNVFDAKEFNGSTWCLCEKEGKYSAIRLNATNDKVEERIDLSKYVDRPWQKSLPKTATPAP